MRVVFLTTKYPCEVEPAAAVFHRTAAEALVRHGLDVEVVAPVAWVPPGLDRFSATCRRYRQIPKRCDNGGVLVHRPRYFQWPRSGVWRTEHWAFARLTRKAVSAKPDVIHGHFACPCGLAAMMAARRWNVPSVITLHGSDVNLFPQSGGFARRWFRAAVTGADVVLGVSEAICRRTEELTGRRPQMLPIGVDMRRFASLPAKAAARQMLGLPDDRLTLLFVGALVPQKGVQELLASTELLRDKNPLAVLVGDGPLALRSIDVLLRWPSGRAPIAR